MVRTPITDDINALCDTIRALTELIAQLRVENQRLKDRAEGLRAQLGIVNPTH